MIEQFTANDGRSLTFEADGERMLVQICDALPAAGLATHVITSFVIDKKQAKQLAKALKEWAKESDDVRKAVR